MAHVVVLVLGDLGRSPRMQYHASSLSRIEGISTVTQIGYEGEHTMFPDSISVKQRRISPWNFEFFRKIALLHAVLKGLGILLKVFLNLIMIKPYSIVIIQNPPCLPAVLAASLISLFNGSTVVIDWHNLGFAMFEQRLGSKHILVKMAFKLENLVCRLAHNHICVSQAMKDWLAEHFDVQATVLYDRPANLFIKNPPTLLQRHHLLSSLDYRDENLFPSITSESDNPCAGIEIDESVIKSIHSTCQTICAEIADSDDEVAQEECILRNDRAKLIVSATSWTEDEDFSILLDALCKLNTLLISAEKIGNAVYEKVLVVVTGKGPMKSAFEKIVIYLTSRGLLSRIAVKTAWLTPDDYSLLLRCADLGVCLHTSSSGIDLPMKVLDMFGSSLPVCAINFPTIRELVTHGHNGMIFDDSEGLCDQMAYLLYPNISENFITEEIGRISQTSSGDDKDGNTWTNLSSPDEIEIKNTDTNKNTNTNTNTNTLENKKANKNTNTHIKTQDKKTITRGESDVFTTNQGVTLSDLREGAGEIGTWDDNWDTVMTPLIMQWLR